MAASRTSTRAWAITTMLLVGSFLALVLFVRNCLGQLPELQLPLTLLPPSDAVYAVFVVTGALLVVLAVVAWRQRGSVWHAASFALFIAGGASNWFDRVSDGRVVDFMNVGIGWLRTGIFNVADMAITTGVIVIILTGLRRAPPKSATSPERA